MAYEVTLEVFQGPVDLLLHLITRQRVDIYEVSLATITEEFLAAVEAREGLDLESATGFLVVAATLLELKSARLLPDGDLDEAGARLLEERDLLLARLVECATYRAAGQWISAGLEMGAGYHGRAVSLEEPYLDIAPDLLGRTAVEDIGRAALRALAPRPVPILDTSHVSPITASVRDAIVSVADGLALAGELDFTALCATARARIDVVVRFLALLELYKAGAVELTQGTRFGDIRARWTGEVDAEMVVIDAEEYVLQEGDR